MSTIEIRLGKRTITMHGHHAEQLVAFVIAAAILLPWLISHVW